MSQQLPAWANELLHSLEIDPVAIDIDTLSSIADHVDDDPTKAQLLVGFIAGYAAGLAEGGGMASFDRAHTASVKFMHKHIASE